MSFIQVKKGECGTSQAVGYSSQGIWGKSEGFFFSPSINLFGCIGSSLQHVRSLLHYAGSFAEGLGFSSCGTGLSCSFPDQEWKRYCLHCKGLLGHQGSPSRVGFIVFRRGRVETRT